VLSGTNKKSGAYAKDARTEKPNGANDVKPLKQGKELCWRQILLWAWPHAGIGKENAEDRIMSGKKEDTDKREAGCNKMKYGKQFQVVCIDLELVSQQRRGLSHRSILRPRRGLNQKAEGSGFAPRDPCRESVSGQRCRLTIQGHVSGRASSLSAKVIK